MIEWWDGDHWTSRLAKGATYAAAGAVLGTLTGGIGLAVAGSFGLSGLAAGAVGATVSGTIFGTISGSIEAANGGNFFAGFGSGFVGGALAGLAGSVGIGLGDYGFSTGGLDFGVNLGSAIGGTNGLFAGLTDIYSHDGLGALAFFADSTIGLPTTAIGLGKSAVEVIGSGNFDEGLSKQSNAFIYQNSSFSRSSSVGNVAGITSRDRARANYLTTLREELLHTWQYREGGFLSLLRLGGEQVFANNPQSRVRGTFPYFSPGTLEFEARSRSEEVIVGRRPWELGCRGCERFY